MKTTQLKTQWAVLSLAIVGAVALTLGIGSHWFFSSLRVAPTPVPVVTQVPISVQAHCSELRGAVRARDTSKLLTIFSNTSHEIPFPATIWMVSPNERWILEVDRLGKWADDDGKERATMGLGFFERWHEPSFTTPTDYLTAILDKHDVVVGYAVHGIGEENKNQLRSNLRK